MNTTEKNTRQSTFLSVSQILLYYVLTYNENTVFNYQAAVIISHDPKSTFITPLTVESFKGLNELDQESNNFNTKKNK